MTLRGDLLILTIKSGAVLSALFCGCMVLAGMYAGYWYSSNTGYIACPDAPSSCPAPPEWYPDLKKPLGAPKGPRKLVSPYVWTRDFEHASVRLDLFDRNASRVIYHK